MNSRFHHFHTKGLTMTNYYKTHNAIKHKNIQIKYQHIILRGQYKYMSYRHGHKWSSTYIRKYHTDIPKYKYAMYSLVNKNWKISNLL